MKFAGRVGVTAVLCVALFAAGAQATINFQGTVGSNALGSTGTSITIPVAAGGVPAGSTVIVALAMDPAAGAVSAIDARGNTYTNDVDRANGSGTSGVRTVVLSAPVTTALVGG